MSVLEPSSIETPSKELLAQCLKRPSLEYRHAFDFCAVKIHYLTDSPMIITSSTFYTLELSRRWSLQKTVLAHTGDRQVTLWAEPEALNGHLMARQIYDSLVLGGHLFVVASGWLAHLLPEWRKSKQKPANQPAGIVRSQTWLREAGFEILNTYGIRTPTNFILGPIAHFYIEMGRKDLADRCYIRIRNGLVISGWKSPWSSVGIILAQKK